MKKERKVIEPNAIVYFDGDVDVPKLNHLFQDFQGDIIINGNLLLKEEGLIVQCNNLYVMGNIVVFGAGINGIWVDGNLYVGGDIDCCDMNINGVCECMGSIDSYEINVAEDLYVKAGIITNGYDINVGGDFTCENEIEAANIVVLSKMHVTDTVEAYSISVG